jgi:1,4-dihydroxy-2-naphthoate octaprenyltransferase
VFLLGGSWGRGFLGALLGFWGLAVVFVLVIVFVPWLNPGFVLVPLVAIPIAVLWLRDSGDEPEPSAPIGDQHPA